MLGIVAFILENVNLMFWKLYLISDFLNNLLILDLKRNASNYLDFLCIAREYEKPKFKAVILKNRLFLNQVTISNGTSSKTYVAKLPSKNINYANENAALNCLDELGCLNKNYKNGNIRHVFYSSVKIITHEC